MLDATPKTPSTTKPETVRLVAEGFAEGEPVRLGKYLVTSLEAGWDTQLTFSDVESGKTHTKVIDTDGPTHAAERAFSWWTNEAWYV